jgi:hypothetical protein
VSAGAGVESLDFSDVDAESVESSAGVESSDVDVESVDSSAGVESSDVDAESVCVDAFVAAGPAGGSSSVGVSPSPTVAFSSATAGPDAPAEPATGVSNSAAAPTVAVTEDVSLSIA